MSDQGDKATRRAAFAVGLFMVCALLSACQPAEGTRPVVSLEEAKQVAVDFAGVFEPPPRTINDILAVLPNPDGKLRECSYTLVTPDELILEAAKKLPSRRTRARFFIHHAGRRFEFGDFPGSVKFQRLAVSRIVFPHYEASNLGLLAVYHAYSNDFDAAESAMARAGGIPRKKRYFSGTQRQYAWNQFRLDTARGAVAAGNGDLFAAERYYRRAIAGADKHYIYGGVYDFALLALARTLMQQGRLMEAENSVRRARRLISSPVTKVLAVARLSEVLYEQGRYDESAALAHHAVFMFRNECVPAASLHLAFANELLGRALVAEGRWAEAGAHFDSIRRDMADDPGSFDRLFTGNLHWALALLRTGEIDRAIEQLEVGLARTRDRLGDEHYKAIETRGYLAMARLARGDLEEALGEFREVVPALVARAREADYRSSSSTARIWRLKLILEGYIDLLTRIAGTALEDEAKINAIAEAFTIAERARWGSVVRALSALAARANLPDAELADLARKEQDVKKQVSALHATLAEVTSRPPGSQDKDLENALKAKIERLRGARSALLDAIETRFPDYAQLVRPKPASIDQIKAVLRPGEALIATYIGDERTYVWAVPHRGEAAFAGVPRGKDDIASDVAILRAALDAKVRTLGDIPDFDLKVAHDLYRSLLEPVAQGWKDAETLFVVADGALGQLPFALLPTRAATIAPDEELLFASYASVPWLVRSHAVTTLPAVTSLVTLRSASTGNAARRSFAGFGDPWFSASQAEPDSEPDLTLTFASGDRLSVRGLPIRLRSLPELDQFDSAELARLPRLPDTADEIRSIARALNADPLQDIFLGGEANEDRVKSMDLSDRKVIVFATHGLVPGDLNGLSQPALALSSPAVVGGDNDGILTLGEVLGLKLDADWVVLSACNTAAGDGAGAEAVSGLGRAFFYAGARALLVSNWPVHSQSAKALTTDIFRRQAADTTLPRAEALRHAMIAMIDGGGYAGPASPDILFSYAHPIFWAPFTLVGDGGGAGLGK